jgi:hypothetical protein
MTNQKQEQKRETKNKRKNFCCTGEQSRRFTPLGYFQKTPNFVKLTPRCP